MLWLNIVDVNVTTKFNAQIRFPVPLPWSVYMGEGRSHHQVQPILQQQLKLDEPLGWCLSWCSH